MSLLAHHTTAAVVKGLNDIPKEDRPPVLATFISFKIMVALGVIFILLTVAGWFLRNRLESSPLYLKIMVYAIPLPYIACAFGWTVTEVGRQPWIVYGLMRTSQAVSPVAASQVALSLPAFIIVYTIIGLIAFTLMAQAARKGPAA
jgi:cytochrome d ubiquinol oxidase subunit I